MLSKKNMNQILDQNNINSYRKNVSLTGYIHIGRYFYL